MITLDNASNNHRMMVELATKFSEIDIPFDEDKNRIR